MSQSSYSLKDLVLARHAVTHARDLAAVRIDLQESSDNISKAEQALQEAREHHQTVERRLRDLEAEVPIWEMIAPVYQLPCELLSHIFELIVQDYEERAIVFAYTSFVDLWYFLSQASAVSKTWRTVIHSTPRLWRNVFAFESNPPTTLWFNHPRTRKLVDRVALRESQIHNVEQCLTRARHSSLTVWALADGLLETIPILDQTNRIGAVEALFIIDSDPYELLRLLESRVSSQDLDRFQVKHIHLQCMGCSYERYKDLLSHFTSVRSVSLRCMGFEFLDDNERIENLTIDLPHLDRLVVVDHFWSVICCELRMVSSPSLRELRIRAGPTSGSGTLRQAYRELEQLSLNSQFICTDGSLFTVTRLVLEGMFMDSDKILSILQHTPAVENLTCHDIGFGDTSFDDVLDALSAARPDGILIPRLKTLRLSVVISDTNMLVDLVETRMHQGCRLAVIALDRDLCCRGFRDRLQPIVTVIEWNPDFEYIERGYHGGCRP